MRVAVVTIFVLAAMTATVGTSSAAVTLTITGEPGFAAVGQVLTTSNFTSGGAITVQASSGSPTINVAVCLPAATTENPSSARCPAPLGDPGFALGGDTSNRANSRTGIATFNDLTVSEIGEYVLYASDGAGSVPDTTNKTFRVYADATICSNGPTQCNGGPVGSLVSDLMQGQVSGNRSGGAPAILAGAVGLDSISCGDGNAHAPAVYSFFASGTDPDVTVVLTIAQAWDQINASNGKSKRAVCFQKDSGGVLQAPFLLPDCTNTVLTDCIVSVNKRGQGKKAPPGASAGDVIITIKVQDGRCY